MRPVNVAKNLFARAWSAGNDRKFWAAIVLVVLVGVWLRSVRFWIDPIGLWGDEACWVSKLFDHPLTRGSSRPIGFVVVSYLFAEYGFNDERTLRLLPYLASLGTLFVLPYVGRQLLRSLGATLVMMVIVALHPLLIDFAKEFKPYSVEVFVHLWMVACVLRYRQTRSARSLGVLLVSAVVAFFFAYNIVFLYPSVFLLLGYQDLEARRWRRLALSSSAAVGTFAVVLGMSLALFGQVQQDEPGEFWGKKYDAFFLEEPAGASGRVQNQLIWTFDRYAAQTRLAGWGRRWWEAGDNELRWMDSRRNVLRTIDSSIWVALHTLGLLWLAVQRRWTDLVLLWLPLLLQVAFNVAGKWPLGDLRMNLFGLVYTIPIAMAALDAAFSSRRRGVSWVARGSSGAAIGATLVLLPPPDPYVKHKPTGHTEMVTILEAMQEVTESAPRRRQPRKDLILVDPYTGCPIRYYLNRHALSKARYGSYFHDRFEVRGLQAKTKLRRRQRAWVIMSKNRGPKETVRWLKKKTRILYHEEFPPTQQLFYVEMK